MNYGALVGIGSNGLTLSANLNDLKSNEGPVFAYFSKEWGIDTTKSLVRFDNPDAIKLLSEAIRVELESGRQIAIKAIENPDPLELFGLVKTTDEIPF